MKNRMISDISNYIFIEDTPCEVDAIFLPGGSHPEQPEYAAELYKKGFAKFIIPSGGVSIKREKWAGVRSKADIYNGTYTSDCEFFTDVLLKNGVPKTAIFGENKSRYTKENAFFSKAVADAHNLQIKKAIIVCKAFHARRCFMLYQMAFPETQINVCPVHCYNITKENWHESEQGIERVLGELERCGNQTADEFKEYAKNQVHFKKIP
ncbi:MAG: YdcF family protein [Clostridia bacterium]|nr:YdcF family protein [Clostridia bacterium]